MQQFQCNLLVADKLLADAGLGSHTVPDEKTLPQILQTFVDEEVSVSAAMHVW